MDNVGRAHKAVDFLSPVKRQLGVICLRDLRLLWLIVGGKEDRFVNKTWRGGLGARVLLAFIG